jgi:hypothetical protein
VSGTVEIELPFVPEDDFVLAINGWRLLEEYKYYWDENDPDSWEYEFILYPGGKVSRYLTVSQR